MIVFGIGVVLLVILGMVVRLQSKSDSSLEKIGTGTWH